MASELWSESAARWKREADQEAVRKEIAAMERKVILDDIREARFQRLTIPTEGERNIILPISLVNRLCEVAEMYLELTKEKSK